MTSDYRINKSALSKLCKQFTYLAVRFQFDRAYLYPVRL